MSEWEKNRLRYNQAMEIINTHLRRIVLNNPEALTIISNDTGLPEGYINRIACCDLKQPEFYKAIVLGAAVKRYVADDYKAPVLCSKCENITDPRLLGLQALEQSAEVLRGLHNAGYKTEADFVALLRALFPKYNDWDNGAQLHGFYDMMFAVRHVLPDAAKALKIIKLKGE